MWKVLGQGRPSDTNALSVFSPTRGFEYRITKVIVANNTSGAIAARVFVDDDGTTYDQSTALYYDKSIAANDSLVIDGDLGMSDPAGNLALRSATGNALSITVFGEEMKKK